MKSRLLLAFGIAIILLVIAAWAVSVRTKGALDQVAQNPFPSSATSSNESSLPVLAERMPEFEGIAAWINSDPLTAAQLKGKVVLIDFWTYSCINCIRTLPYVTSWQEKYGDKGFTVIGVHTPEFAFEKEEKNVREATLRHHITYPVALDNEYKTWTNYDNHYWPAHYLFDAQGRLREVHFGEGNYEETEMNIQALLKEAGHDADMDVTQVPSTTDFSKIGSPETYLGYARQESLESPEPVARNAAGHYTLAAKPTLNYFSLGGTWTIEAERAVPDKGGKLRFRYSASTANLVLSNEHPDGPALRVEVKIDGKPVAEGLRGADINVGEDGTTYLLVKDQRLYELTNAGANYGEHLLELEFDEPSTAAYAFTFG